MFFLLGIMYILGGGLLYIFIIFLGKKISKFGFYSLIKKFYKNI